MSTPAPNVPPPPADDAATQDPPPRVIDENTDMSTLTDQEIMRLMEGMDHNNDVMSKVRFHVSGNMIVNEAVTDTSAIDQSSDTIDGYQG